MINIICVGKLKEKALLSLQQEYLKRLTKYHNVKVIEVKDISNELPKQRILELEGKQILKNIQESDFCILLDLCGKMYSSESFSKKMDELFIQGKSKINFIIGGSLGVCDEVRNSVQMRWKISDLTFTHQLCRIIVLEQIYRSFKIQSNEIYHK